MLYRVFANIVSSLALLHDSSSNFSVSITMIDVKTKGQIVSLDWTDSDYWSI